MEGVVMQKSKGKQSEKKLELEEGKCIQKIP